MTLEEYETELEKIKNLSELNEKLLEEAKKAGGIRSLTPLLNKNRTASKKYLEIIKRISQEFNVSEKFLDVHWYMMLTGGGLT
jgi:FMN-dependent NADH-azoreductase